jgi:hypothetical protein
MAQRDWNNERSIASRAETMGGIIRYLIIASQGRQPTEGCEQMEKMSRISNGSGFREGQGYSKRP